MSIDYTFKTDKVNRDELQELFSSVKWESAKYPDKLFKALEGSHSVLTAWDGDKLIGLINVLSDGILTAYFHYMLVHPDYQGFGIGKKLLDLMLERYAEYPTKVLIAYPEVVEFYNRCGFEKKKGTVPLYISELV